jgi:hypothetical protein
MQPGYRPRSGPVSGINLLEQATCMTRPVGGAGPLRQKTRPFALGRADQPVSASTRRGIARSDKPRSGLDPGNPEPLRGVQTREGELSELLLVVAARAHLAGPCGLCYDG